MNWFERGLVRLILFFPIAWVCCYIGSDIGLAIGPQGRGIDVLGLVIGFVVAIFITVLLPLRRRARDASLELHLR